MKMRTKIYNKNKDIYIRNISSLPKGWVEEYVQSE